MSYFQTCTLGDSLSHRCHKDSDENARARLNEMDYNSAQSLPLLFFSQVEKFPEKPFLWRKVGGEWRSMSWRETSTAVKNLCRGLRSLGVEVGDRVCLVSENRPEWLVADLAIMSAGAITVPAYTTNTVDDHAHILQDSGAKIVIVSTAHLTERVLPAAKRVGVNTVLMIDEYKDSTAQGVQVLSLETLHDRTLTASEDIELDAGRAKREDTACIIYTSGTGGLPKGVILSHGAIICNCKGADELLRTLPSYGTDTEKFLSFLPLSHSYEHTAGQFFPLSIGAEIYYAEGIDRLVQNMAEVQPTIMTAVPRLYETIHSRIVRDVEQTGGLRAKMFSATLALGKQRYEAPQSMSLGARVLNRVLDRLVRSKIQQRFGGRLKAFVSGGAPLNNEIGVFFLSLGLRILQGYGQTEAAPVISCNPPDHVKIHTVGPPLHGVDVQIASDGEILVKGELVMQGYWNNVEATAETLKDGWLHTGDIGVVDEDGYIQITDRKKDIIVNSGGDNLSPQRVEGILTVEKEISQAMVYGDKRPHLVAVIVADPEFAEEWAKSHDCVNDPRALAENEDFKKAIGEAVARVNEKVSIIERVRQFIISADPFTIENEMMTATLKIRRHVIQKTHGEALEALYGR